jgi:hypothetical protein
MAAISIKYRFPSRTAQLPLKNRRVFSKRNLDLLNEMKQSQPWRFLLWALNRHSQIGLALAWHTQPRSIKNSKKLGKNLTSGILIVAWRVEVS